MQMISKLYEDFNDLEKRAETMIAGISPTAVLIFSTSTAYQPDLQFDECEGDQTISITGREHQAVDICHDILPSALILHS